MNISGLIVDVLPEHLAALRSDLDRWPGVQVHAGAPHGRLVVTVETDTDCATTDTFARIAERDGVLSVALAYHQIETEPDMEVRDDADAT